MPFYEYECHACGTHHEAMQKMSDTPLKTCPECGKAALVRLISAPVFRLKGGGWYETDFKSDKENKRNLAGGEEKPAADGEGGSRRASAKKPATATSKSAGAKTRSAAKAKAKPKAKVTAKAKAKAKPKPKPKAKAVARPKSKSAPKASAKVAAKSRRSVATAARVTRKANAKAKTERR